MSFLEFRRELLKWVDESEEKNLICSHEVSENMIKPNKLRCQKFETFSTTTNYFRETTELNRCFE